MTLAPSVFTQYSNRMLSSVRPEWSLRLGLGLVYLYSGSSLLAHPERWYGFVPPWFVSTVSRFVSFDRYLQTQGVGELLIAFLLFAWFLDRRIVRAATVLAALEMAGILIFSGIDLVTFRDIGLLGASSALALMLFQRHVGEERI